MGTVVVIKGRAAHIVLTLKIIHITSNIDIMEHAEITMVLISCVAGQVGVKLI